jgi:long-chain acyl-CoA synthetase
MSNFYEQIAAAAGRFAGRPAIEFIHAGAPDEITTTTYRQLMAAAARWDRWFRDIAQVATGDRVAILSENGAPWIAAYLGVLRAGAVAVPLDTAYSADQVATVLRDCDARILLASARRLPVAQAAAAQCPAARVSELTFDPPNLPATGHDAPAADRASDDAAVLLYTSGTTADPKGVVLTHANLEAERAAALAVIHVTEEDRVLGVLPLFHALAQMTNLLLPLSAGARVIFLESISSGTLVAALQSRAITIFACVPQFFYLIHERVMSEVARRGLAAQWVFRALIQLNARVRRLAGANLGRSLFGRIHRTLGLSMRMLITGGSRFDSAIGRDLYGLGFVLLNGYGLTETSGAATVVRPNDVFTTSVGQPLPGVEVRIVSSGPADGANGLIDGEVLIRGPIVMREYFGRPDATDAVLRDGWLHTGDLGRLDERGRLYITGRKKDVIVLSSGKNLYPEEIEAHYARAPVIKELCVLGRQAADRPSAERLHAVVVIDDDALRARGAVNIRELLRFELETLSAQLPSHKRILTYDISPDPLPRTSTGKLRRSEVERMAVAREQAPLAARVIAKDDAEWLAVPAHAGIVNVISRRLSRRHLHPDDNLELDLGLDSMERVELLALLERHAHVQVAADARATIFTVRQLVAALLTSPPMPGSPASDLDEAAEPWEAILAEPAPAEISEALSRTRFLTAATLFVLIRLCTMATRLIPGWQIRGQSHLPRSGPCIICPNHQTFLDGFFVAAALPFAMFRRVFFVGAAEYFQTPAMRSVARAINIVPVDPDTHLVAAMRAAAAGLQQRKILILFPEGERSIDGGLKPFRKGAAILAAHLSVPVVPAAIGGLFPIWPRGQGVQLGSLRPGRSQPITLQFGPPLSMTEEGAAAGTSRIRQAVADAMNASPP